MDEEIKTININPNFTCHILLIQFMCNECPLVFKERERFLRHQEVHKRENEIINCAMCDISVRRKEYRQHKITQHEAQKHKMKCSVCNKFYTRTVHLRKHYAEEHEEFGVTISVICELCGYGTYSYGGLLNHKRIYHNPQKLFLCSACPKQFRTKSLLDNHMPVHTGETPFQCNVCGKKYKHRSGLFYHEKMHKEQFLECPHCNRQFVAKHNMESHMRVCVTDQYLVEHNEGDYQKINDLEKRKKSENRNQILNTKSQNRSRNENENHNLNTIWTKLST
uniref:Zinc finger protein 525-like isoform X2 n=1 Tax=Diabrotica virgifera virgifera TaxID=50390 RepID=A0A6P7EZR4_DIAVI